VWAVCRKLLVRLVLPANNFLLIWILGEKTRQDVRFFFLLSSFLLISPSPPTAPFALLSAKLSEAPTDRLGTANIQEWRRRSLSPFLASYP
jgi:hypothetical protein